MRANTSGWAAVVQKQRQNQQGIEPQLESEPFPPLSLSNTLSTKNTDTILEKPFSSVLLPSPNLSSLEQNKYPKNKQSSAGHFNSSKGTKFLKNGDDVDSYQIIKELHSWADESLIKDVMAGVNNEFAQAMKILEDMVSLDQTVVLHDDSEAKKPDINKISNADELSFPCVQKIKEEKDRKGKEVNEDDLSGENVNLEDLNNAIKKCLNISSKNLINYPASFVDKLHGNASIGFFRFAPIEPELWEEDDIYSFQRKDAIRMMRSAARHSKSASYAYLRGDHLTAQYFSVKAQEEWLAAGELNTKAAKEILRVQNSKNDEWTLDLHGLHSTEAVAALQEHLKKIESQVSVNHSVFQRGVNGEMESTLYLLHSNGFDAESSTKRLQQPSKQRPSILHVITGKGNHSRGEAALPIVIKSFLADNGYRFDEIRPGVIAVRPKFRPQ